MVERLKEFLNCCNINQTYPEFLDDRQKLVKKITSSLDYIKDFTFYNALASKTRLLIYRLIQQEPMCNCSLSKIIGLSEGSITYHIKKLEGANLVIGRNRGHFVIYYTPETLRVALEENQ